MSSSTQNDLQSEQNNSESRIVDRLSNPQNVERYLPSPRPRRPTFFVFPLLPQGITVKELSIIKLAAQFVSVYGMCFRWDLAKSVSTNPQFKFMNEGDSRYTFYSRLLHNYPSVLFRSEKVKNPNNRNGASPATFLDGFFNLVRQVLENDKEGVEMAMIDLYAVEYFFNKEGPPPGNRAMRMNQPPQMQPPHGIQPDAPPTDDLQPPPRLLLPEGFTLEELNIIRPTAQFAAFFGLDFMSGVIMDLPLFEFMLQPSSRNPFFHCLCRMYKRVLRKTSEDSTRPCIEAVGEKFFNLVRQVLGKEVEVGVEMAMIDSYAFEYFANLEWMKLGPSHGNLSILRNPPPEIQPDAPATEDAEPSIFVLLSLPEGFTTLKDLPSPRPRRPTFFVFPLLPQGITVKELSIIKLAAQFVSVYGMCFRWDLVKSVSTNPQLKFMNEGDSRYTFYSRLLHNYPSVLFRSEKVKNPNNRNGASPVTFLDGFFNLVRQVLENDKEGVEMAMIDLYAVEYFFNKEGPPPGNRAMMMNQPPQMQPPHGIQPDAPPTDDLQPPSRLVLPEGFTLEELNIIRLTAQFAAFFGLDFMTGVVADLCFYDLYEVMLQPSSRNPFFHCLCRMYKRVLRKTSEDSTRPCREAVGEKFYNLARQVLEKEVEVGVEMAMIDSYAFEYFANLEWMNPPLQMIPPLGSGSAPRPRMSPRPPLQMKAPLGSGSAPPRPRMSPPPSLPLPEEPDPKRGKFDESALVPEDQFIAQDPGSSTIRGSVENIKNGQLIEITLQSLSENVASLKERISGKIQIPAKRQKLCGIAGFLMDSMSLAHYNVGAGDVLRLCL